MSIWVLIIFFISAAGGLAFMFWFGLGGIRATQKCPTCDVGYLGDKRGCSYCDD